MLTRLRGDWTSPSAAWPASWGEGERRDTAAERAPASPLRCRVTPRLRRLARLRVPDIDSEITWPGLDTRPARKIRGCGGRGGAGAGVESGDGSRAAPGGGRRRTGVLPGARGARASRYP